MVPFFSSSHHRDFEPLMKFHNTTKRRDREEERKVNNPKNQCPPTATLHLYQNLQSKYTKILLTLPMIRVVDQDEEEWCSYKLVSRQIIFLSDVNNIVDCKAWLGGQNLRTNVDIWGNYLLKLIFKKWRNLDLYFSLYIKVFDCPTFMTRENRLNNQQMIFQKLRSQP